MADILRYNKIAMTREIAELRGRRCYDDTIGTFWAPRVEHTYSAFEAALGQALPLDELRQLDEARAAITAGETAMAAIAADAKNANQYYQNAGMADIDKAFTNEAAQLRGYIDRSGPRIVKRMEERRQERRAGLLSLYHGTRAAPDIIGHILSFL